MTSHPYARRKFCIGAASAAIAQALVPHARAQSAQGAKYPTRPVRLIVPSPPGGGPDIVGRLVAQLLSQKWNQQLLIENIGGASGQVGALTVARAPADGYTLLFSAPTPLTIAERPQWTAAIKAAGIAIRKD